ncbi:baseplate J/gp47 family protein [Thalassomonas sp. RHCl1]|uniref:baseplate J/gp47 family protein n=1 Tax=Thalassomonas sp. RHCl1 TaxID=2995320 RepID=UPI00248B51B9|nr:baseplate J/gp47 family protein [Thalassomonas sp. RHCl1]
MDIEICKTKNPLVRDGTSQQQRWLKQLHPRYARIDDRSMADLLNFANHYSRELQYYDNQDQTDGDWHAFFDSDLACIIAAVANKDNNNYKVLLYQLKSYLNEKSPAEHILASGVLETLIKLSFQLAYEINDWAIKAQNDGGFKQHLHRLITSELALALSETVNSYNALLELPPPEEAAIPHQLPSFEFNAKQVHHQVFSALWKTAANENGDTEHQWQSLSDRFIFPEITPQPGEPLSPEQKALITASSVSLASAAQLFLQAQNQLIQAAPGYLFHLIHHNENHKPHIALFIAFTRLYKFAQIHINSLTGKHLDFYYRDILGFRPHGATKDRVHLLFELAKSPKHHKLEQGTLFNAGFDSDGTPVHYALNNELVVNKASIKESGDIKSVYIDNGPGMPVFSAAVANSSDGKGKAFTNPEPRWKPFGQSQLVNGELKSIETRTGEVAQLGFAISSPLLDLREGERTISLKLYGTMPNPRTSPVTLSPDLIKVNLSGEKQWIEAQISSFLQQSDHLALTVTLSVDQAAITPFDAQILTGRDYQSRFPVMQIILRHDSETAELESAQENLDQKKQDQEDEKQQNQASANQNKVFAYQTLKEIQVTGLILDVAVTGVKNLIVQSDLGVLDGSKPFLPFGPKPVLAGAFYIGCDEAFRKPVTSVSISASWQGAPISFTEHYKAYYDDILPAQPADPSATSGSTTVVITEAIEPQAKINENNIKAKVSVLKNYAWQEKQAELVLFNKTAANTGGQANAGEETELPQYKLTVELKADPGTNEPLMPQAPALDKLTSFNNTLAQGFIKLSVNGPLDVLGHKRYSRVYSKRVIQQINHPKLTLIPNEPYTPVLQDISLNYQAKISVAVNQLGTEAGLSLYHIYPFGSSLAKADSTASANTATTAGLIPLMPRFVTEEDGQLKQNRGEMYIGLSDTRLPQLVTLFFQVAEGSADPRFNKETIHWSVLTNNQWQALTAKEVITDSTNAFNTSGIVAITLPGEVNDNNTLLPPGKVWLRAAVLEQPTAVCDLITIATQAGEASFSNDNNHQEFLASPLPANTISKLKVKQSTIKGISQPFAAVEGKAGENDSRFNTRVAERLRHKDRAITLWDYEHLVLQAFDDIYKAKCINHSSYLYPKKNPDNSQTLMTSEFAPGYVTVIVIASLTNKNAIDPLEPRASLNKLDKIKSFLQQRMTPWAAEKLRVLNPMYEAIQLEFNVTFRSGFDPGLYTETLNQDLIAFLSPWAFDSNNKAEIHFGGKIHRSVLVNFIEQREYVDYLTEVKMHQHLEPPPGTPASDATSFYDIEQATPGSARSIFVSHKKHLITAGGSCK